MTIDTLLFACYDFQSKVGDECIHDVVPAVDGVVFHMEDGTTYKYFQSEDCLKQRVGTWRDGYWEKI